MICSALHCSKELSINLSKGNQAPFDAGYNCLGRAATTTKVHRTSKRDQQNFLLLRPWFLFLLCLPLLHTQGSYNSILRPSRNCCSCCKVFTLLQFGSVRFGVHYFVVAIKVICHICRRPLGAIKAQSEHFLCQPDDSHSPLALPILENQFKERKSYQSFRCTNPFY